VFRREGGNIERSHKNKQQTKQPKRKEQKQKNKATLNYTFLLTDQGILLTSN
jgi:hypothetical protein